MGGGRVPDTGDRGGLIDGLDIVDEFVIAGLVFAEELGDGSRVEGDEFINSMLVVSSAVLPSVIIWAIEFDIVFCSFCSFCLGILFEIGRTTE